MSRLVGGITNHELFDDHYIVWRGDRNYDKTKQKMGSGVLAAIRRELAWDFIGDWDPTAEDMWINLKLHHKMLWIIYKIH